MRTMIPLFAAAALAFTALPSVADETQAVAEIFACSYLDGKGWSDVEAANKQYNAALKKVGGGLEEINSFAWRPLRGTPAIDLLWSTNSPDGLNQMAANLARYAASEEGQAADATWETVVDCQEAVFFQERLYGPEEIPDLPTNYVIESYGCNLQPGKSMADVAEIEKKWHSFVSKLPNQPPTFRRVPFIGNPPFGHMYFVVHQDLASYAASSTDYLTAEGQGALQGEIDAVQSCRVILWTGQQMTP